MKEMEREKERKTQEDRDIGREKQTDRDTKT